jgi:hypothetical protein
MISMPFSTVTQAQVNASGQQVCSSVKIGEALAKMEPSNYGSIALATAVNSSTYRQEESSLPANQSLQYVGAYRAFSVNEQLCSPTVTSIHVAFVTNGARPQVQVDIVEDSNMSDVSGVTTVPALPKMADQACGVAPPTACRSGFTLSKSDGSDMDCHIFMDYYMPPMQGGNPNQGCGNWQSQFCALAIWPGQTVDAAGAQGIAQAGTEAYLYTACYDQCGWGGLLHVD